MSISFEQLTEAVRPNLLYHGTTVDSARVILRSDMIHALTSHDHGPFDKTTHGVSFSRSLRVSMWFGSVVFAVDRQKLSTQQKVKPVQYFRGLVSARTTALQQRIGRSGYSTEMEEFAVGSVRNLDKILHAIYIDNRLQDNHMLPASLIHHPLVQFIQWVPSKSG